MSKSFIFILFLEKQFPNFERVKIFRKKFNMKMNHMINNKNKKKQDFSNNFWLNKLTKRFS